MLYQFAFVFFSPCQENASSLPSGENAGKALPPGELVNGTTRVGGSEFLADCAQKNHAAKIPNTTVADNAESIPHRGTTLFFAVGTSAARTPDRLDVVSR